MKRILLILVFILACAVANAQVQSQRVIFTASNPPTACVSGKVYSNPALNPAKAWVGTSTGACTEIDASAGAPKDATYIVQTPNATLTNEQALSLLATGIPLITTTTGVISISNVDNTSDATKNAAAVALTNKTSVGSVFFFTAASDPADASAFRFGNNEYAAWEKATPGTDWTLGVNASDVLITNAPFRALTITDDGLTSGRVPFAGTGGLLQDDADLSFSVDTLTFTKGIASTNLTIGAGSAITSSGAGGALGALSFATPGTGVAASLAIANNTAGGYSPIDGTATLTNKTINGASNTLTVRLANDISGFGTGIATALAINTGSAGAPVLFNGALGSPSSVGTMPAFTLGGTVSGGGNQINNVIIGTSTPLAGFHTTLSATSSLVTPIIGPTADGTTAIKFTKADLSTVVGVVDTTNTRWRIGSGVAPTVALDVTGAVTVSGQILAAAGSAGTQSIAFGANGLGFYQIDVNTIGVIRGGISTPSMNIGQALMMGSTGRVGWSGAADNVTPGAGFDTNISRNAAGISQFGTSANNALGSWLATNGTLSGTLSVTGHTTFEGVTSTGATGTGKLVYDTAPQLSLIELGHATDTTITRVSAGVIAVEGATIPTLSASNVFTGTIQSVSAALPDIKLLDTGGNNAAFINNSADVAVIGINRDPATGTFVQTGKAAAQINLTGASSSGIIDFRVSSTNNTLPPVQMSIAGSGAITLNSGVTNAAGTPGSICYNTSTFEMTKNNALTCTVSSRDFKQGIIDLDQSSAFDKLRPVEFSYRDQPDRKRWGFIAEEAGSADHRFADGYDASGTPRSLDQNGILAATVQEVQQLKAIVIVLRKEIEVLKARQ